uniref:DUF6534 domain-containing protein n=1 Tax=Moniliophthora roreri TaxID=221103 RepID=A0A0W0G7A0_MONRR
MSSPNVEDTLGAALIGLGVSCIVFGILSTEVFTYYSRYPRDPNGYKLLVAFVWLLELVDQGCIGHFIYYYMISNFTKPLVLFTGDVVWTLLVSLHRVFVRVIADGGDFQIQVVLGAAAGTIVKCCFAMRVWRFSNHNLPLTALIILLSLGQFGLAISAFSIFMHMDHASYQLHLFQRTPSEVLCLMPSSFGLKKLMYANRLKLIATLALGTGALTDLITAFTLSYYLRKLRTGYQKSDLLVNKLSLYAINTGALTSVMSLGALIFYDIQPTTFQFLAFYFTLSKLYAISLMCTLNTRKVICGQGTDRELSTQTADQTLPRFIVSHHSHQTRSQLPLHTKSQLEIGVHHEVSVVSDVGTDSFSPVKDLASYPPKSPDPYTWQ